MSRYFTSKYAMLNVVQAEIKLVDGISCTFPKIVDVCD